jgi:hypothetical protein
MNIDLDVGDESVFADRTFDSGSLFSFDSDSEAKPTIPNWCDLPLELLMIIFRFTGPGHYLYVALTCKLFRRLYKEASSECEAWHKNGWKITLYMNGGASIGCAALAMELYPDVFDKSEYRLYLISGAIRTNHPNVVNWMFANDWFWYVTADKCAQLGAVEVIVWMWLRGSFSDLDSDDYDTTLAKYFDGDGFTLKADEVRKHYDFDNIRWRHHGVRSDAIQCLRCGGKYARQKPWYYACAYWEVENRVRECHEHVYRDHFRTINL